MQIRLNHLIILKNTKMKQTFIFALVIASFFSATSLQAQKGFSLSVKAAPQFSFMINEDDNDNNRYDSKATFNAGFGVGAAYNFTPKLGVGLDVLYSLQGQRYELNGAEYYQKADYVKIPLMFTYNTNPLKQISFVGKIGPQLSILTRSKLTDDDGHDLIDDNKEKYQSTTFGAMALAGVQYRLNPRIFLTTGIRFDYDFSNSEDDNHPSYSRGRADTYNSTVGLEVGLKYMLK